VDAYNNGAIDIDTAIPILLRRLEMSNRTKKQSGSVEWLIGLAILILIGIGALSYFQLLKLEVVFIGMQIVLGVGILLVLLTIVTIVFARLDLADPKQALGLPEGTVRALMALILLLVFIICGLWLFYTVAFPPTNGTNGTPILITDDGARLAQQLITTIGTLVVAVAGFYFGTTAVTAAREAVSLSAPLIRSIDTTEGTINQEYALKIIGKNFRLPKTVRLVRGSNEIICADILSSETEIRCKIKIPADIQAESMWDLNIVNADGGEDTLPETFFVKSASS
jgi:hypothetical protein